MILQDPSYVMALLHSQFGRPRLEIEGAGAPSTAAQYLRWIGHRADGEGELAIYVINDWYADTSFNTEYRTEHVEIPKAGIVNLIQNAGRSSSGRANLNIKGKHITHFESWDDYSGTHHGSSPVPHDVMVNLSLKLTEQRPILSVQYG